MFDLEQRVACTCDVSQTAWVGFRRKDGEGEQRDLTADGKSRSCGNSSG